MFWFSDLFWPNSADGSCVSDFFTLLSPVTPAVIWLDLFPLFFIKAPQGFIALQQSQAC